MLAFHHVESSRRDPPATHNCRLAAIRSFVDHLLRHDLTRAEQYGRIRAIPTKRAAQRLVSYLEPEEARAVIAQVVDDDAIGVRDRALLLFLYNTGARIAEALAVRVRDLWLERPRQVRLHGKGTKERMCPLWVETAATLRPLTASASAPDDLVFRNARGAALTRDGATYVIAKYPACRGVRERRTLT